MATTDWETASHCPRCGESGRKVGTRRVVMRIGSTAHILMCENKQCRWFGTTWIVQVDKDGSIPIREQGAKQFPKLPEISEEKFQEQLDRQLKLETKAGAEIRNQLAN